jgi:asparagine N-glycosylation enzyme membrane subunit Stt3
VTRERLAVFGYAYVALALPATLVGLGHTNVQSGLFTGAAFAFLWFLASLRARLDRYDPDGFFASVVVLGGSAFIALQTLALVLGTPRVAAPASACAATVIVGSSLAALRARKVTKPFGYAGIAGGIAVLVFGIVEGTASWTLAGRDVFASMLGFMIWVVVTATYLLRR